VSTTWLAAGRRALRCGAAVAVAALVASLAAQPAVADPDVTEAQRRVEAVSAELTELTRQLDAAADAYETAQAHHLRLQDELADADDVVADARGHVAAVIEAFEARVVGVYKRPDAEVALASAVLRAPDPATALHRAALISRVTVRGARGITEAQRIEAVTTDAVHQHQVVFAGATGAAADLEHVAADLKLAVQTAEHRVEAATRRLAAAEEEADRRARAEAARLADSGGPVVVDGKVCPIGAPNGFIDSWGFPRSGGRRHQGVDMFAAYGMPLYAVSEGVIQQVGTNRLGGLYVNLIDLAGNRYYYAHLSAAHVVTGERVHAGQVIGANGDSGNARGTPPHLHWQYHPGNGPPVNPYPLARALCRGG
jgi:peptidoglycan LD-endopeptidase LytH